MAALHAVEAPGLFSVVKGAGEGSGMEELEQWREAGKAVGIKLGVIQERKRILRLLEWELWDEFQKSHNARAAWQTMEMLVTAIKGENK